MGDAVELAVEASSLIRRAFMSYDEFYGFSTTSCQVYDTAWVAMIAKSVNGEKQWLFTECYHYLLKTQSDDGGWDTHPTQTAGILNTAAALLALLRHAAEPLQIADVSPAELRKRISSATKSLGTHLAAWGDVLTTNHVDAKLIVPSMLEHIEKEDSTITFEFESRGTLRDQNAAILSHFRPQSLYSNAPSSAIHSLEALVGKIDFDRVSQHLFRGTMMASPSSTAAYLMNASSWDEEAEAYLRHIIKSGAGNGNGGIPGTFPTTYFEYSWILATLLGARFSKSDLDCPELYGIKDILVKAFQDEHGIIGFAPRIAAVDDTARGLLALTMLGHNVNPEPMITRFERDDHFQTSDSERDPSFASNCHVLLALLHQDDIPRYLPQIRKTVNFICKCWWNSDGRTKDKWHLSHLYPTMLMVQAFTDLLRLLDSGTLPGLLDMEWQWKVSISLFQACLRTLLEQSEDGSWNSSPEQTSYSILTLGEARNVCFFADLQLPLKSAIDRGISFLNRCSFRSLDYNWISKTAYGVTFVAEAYLLAALRVGTSSDAAASIGSSLGRGISPPKMEYYMQLVRQTKLFSALPYWQVQASLVESGLFVPLLKAQRLGVFMRDEAKVSDDTYFNIIPFTWVGCNNRSCTFASTSFLYDMMMISLFTFQIDEFFESVATPKFSANTNGLHELIDKTIAGVTDSHTSADSIEEENGLTEKSKLPEPLEVSAPLSRFVAYLLRHQGVLAASDWDRENLRRELRVFLHAHATQVEDSARFNLQSRLRADVFDSPSRSFFQWVRTTAADFVGSAYALTFACCLMSTSLGGGAELFPSVREKYLAAAAALHLSTTCRLYNDFSSVARDTVERNVNSVHFPEFSEHPTTGVDAKKQALVALARYERSCLDQALDRLEQEVLKSRLGNVARLHRRKINILKFYCDVGHLWNQLYVLRDLSSTIEREKKREAANP